MQANWQLFSQKIASFSGPSFEVHFAKILAVWGQLVVLQIGQDFPELEEEAFAGFVAVGVHVEIQP